jgi:hypothetical protein
MILVTLQKDIKTQKLFVKSWSFVTKEQAKSIALIDGAQVILESSKVMDGFFKNPTRFFYDEGYLRNGYGINE